MDAPCLAWAAMRWRQDPRQEATVSKSVHTKASDCGAHPMVKGLSPCRAAYANHHGIVWPSHAQKLPLTFIVTLSVRPSSCRTALSRVNSFSGCTFCARARDNQTAVAEERSTRGPLSPSKQGCGANTQSVIAGTGTLARDRVSKAAQASLVLQGSVQRSGSQVMGNSTFWNGADRSVSTVPGCRRTQATLCLRRANSTDMHFVSCAGNGESLSQGATAGRPLISATPASVCPWRAINSQQPRGQLEEVE